MGRQAMKTAGILIGMFLVGAYASGWGSLMINAGKAGGGIVKNLQGRG